jgi:hypothetical protein
MTTRLNPITTPRHELRAEKARRNREAALAAFIGKKAEIDEMLARLQALRRTARPRARPRRRPAGSPQWRSATARFRIAYRRDLPRVLKLTGRIK